MIEVNTISAGEVWKMLEAVSDPEIPVLSIVDLGIVRNVEIDVSNKIKITITPTYTACPAMDMININIRIALLENGFTNIEIKTVLSPAWTTDWMSEAGKQKLKAYGIAPPKVKQHTAAVQCPHCNSYHTQLISYFGSTACKALYKCEDCKEPFDYFKCH